MDWDGIGSFALFAAMGMIGAAFLLGPIGRSISKRIAGRDADSGGDEVLARLREVEQRLAEVEAANTRLAELEERLDFAERLLTQSGGAERLPGAGEAEAGRHG